MTCNIFHLRADALEAASQEGEVAKIEDVLAIIERTLLPHNPSDAMSDRALIMQLELARSSLQDALGRAKRHAGQDVEDRPDGFDDEGSEV